MKRLLIRLVPACFIIGAAMEFFMIKTGFYNIVTSKEAQRYHDADLDRLRRKKRMEEIKLEFTDQNNDNSNVK